MRGHLFRGPVQGRCSVRESVVDRKYTSDEPQVHLPSRFNGLGIDPRHRQAYCLALPAIDTESQLMMNTNSPQTGARPSKAVWIKRLGVLGFCFFLVKGLVWLGVGAAAVIGSLSVLD